MSELDREPTADELRESIRAEAKLAEMDFAEDIALWTEEETDAQLRRQFAETYRKIIGVDPSQRHDLRQGLERIEAGGGMPVKELIASLDRAFSLKERAREAREKQTPSAPVTELLRGLRGNR